MKAFSDSVLFPVAGPTLPVTVDSY